MRAATRGRLDALRGACSGWRFQSHAPGTGGAGGRPIVPEGNLNPETIAVKKQGLHAFSGNDRYRRREAVRAWVATETEAGAEAVRLAPRGLQVPDLDAALCAMSLFQARRIVVVENAYDLTKPCRDLLCARLDGGVAPLVLVEYEGRRTHKPLIDRAAGHERFEPLRFADAVRWSSAYAQSGHGAQMDRSAAEMLVSRYGHADTGRLAREIDKIAALADGRITRGYIEAAGSAAMLPPPWDFYDAVGQRRHARAREILGEFLRHPDWPGVRLVTGLTYHMINLGSVLAGLEAGKAPGEASRGISPPFLRKKFQAQARSWTLPEVDRALVALADADRDLKRGGDDRRTLFSCLGRIHFAPNA